MTKTQFFSLVGFLTVSFVGTQLAQWDKSNQLVTGLAVMNANFDSLEKNLEKTLNDHAGRIHSLEVYHQNGGK